jgi:hypothetical protein
MVDMNVCWIACLLILIFISCLKLANTLRLLLYLNLALVYSIRMSWTVYLDIFHVMRAFLGGLQLTDAVGLVLNLN